MQLGTRWPVGGSAPRSLPSEMRSAIASLETELAADHVDASTWRWTLTYLEGKPVAELDDGTRILLDSTGQAQMHREQDTHDDED